MYKVVGEEGWSSHSLQEMKVLLGFLAKQVGFWGPGDVLGSFDSLCSCPISVSFEVMTVSSPKANNHLFYFITIAKLVFDLLPAYSLISKLWFMVCVAAQS